MVIKYLKFISTIFLTQPIVACFYFISKISYPRYVVQIIFDLYSC